MGKPTRTSSCPGYEARHLISSLLRVEATTLRGRNADAVLIQLVRLLARQAAREWAERRPGGDYPTPPFPLPENQT